MSLFATGSTTYYFHAAGKVVKTPSPPSQQNPWQKMAAGQGSVFHWCHVISNHLSWVLNCSDLFSVASIAELILALRALTCFRSCTQHISHFVCFALTNMSYISNTCSSTGIVSKICLEWPPWCKSDGGVARSHNQLLFDWVTWVVRPMAVDKWVGQC